MEHAGRHRISTAVLIAALGISTFYNATCALGVTSGGAKAIPEGKMKVVIDAADINKYVETSRTSFESDLKRLVDIPSVSMDPAHRGDIDKLAHAAVELLKSYGATAELVRTKGNPVVIGEFTSSPQAPTVTVYNHLDVQPADAAEWNSAPFEMTIDNGVYRGRGSTDDKGPALTVLYAAKYAHEHKLPINIKFIWELEEEIGSPSFEQFLKENPAKLKTDSVVISDTIWVSRERPAIPYGLRGLQGLLIKLRTGKKDVHSGLTGGLARNPIGELSQLISECYDAKTGRVNIPGFYDGVRKPNADELNNFVKSGFTVENFKKAHELLTVRTQDSREGSERIWALPTFEVHGIVGGYSGPGVKTIVPHEAEAKISMRLVPDQDPVKVLQVVTAFIKERCPDCEVIPEGTLRPFVGDVNNPYNAAAKQAMTSAFGREPAFTREGGSIGAVVSMHDNLHVPIVFLGLSLPEHGYHAINENFDWQQASGGMKMFTKYFELLSEMKK
jgi:acetylornithine deacetylase/succinyl-diaminopimelate desuccinylase-like protein